MEGEPLDSVEVENQPFRFQIVTGGGRPAVLFSISVPFSHSWRRWNLRDSAKYMACNRSIQHR